MARCSFVRIPPPPSIPSLLLALLTPVHRPALMLSAKEKEEAAADDPWGMQALIDGVS